MQDIVIFTTDVARCPYYLAESENVKSRFACVLPTDYINMANRNRGNNFIIPITREECEVRKNNNFIKQFYFISNF